jgi:hypothetical protein
MHVGLMPADDAASHGADHPMVARVVTCRTADDSAFDAAFGRRWGDQARKHECEGSHINRTS